MDEAVRTLNRLNPDVGILPIGDGSFLRYGKPLTGYPVGGLLRLLAEKAPVADGVLYEPDAIGPGACPGEVAPLMRAVFGGMDGLQVGWVCGRNLRLNALEYHKCSEVVIAGSDMVVFMGLVQDIRWPEGSYDVSQVQAYFVPRGTVYEISPWCLHYAPVHVHAGEGFRCAILLPRGTNTTLDYEPERSGEGKLLFGRNKWLVAHTDDRSLQGSGAHFGLVGRNIRLTTMQ